jgi:serine/threonine protein kinase
MNVTNICPDCGAKIPSDAPQRQCPQCLLKAGLESQGAVPATRSSPSQARFVPPTIAELQPSFPQFELLELLGHGGMGAVYKARQLGLQRLVAVKILPPEVGQSPAFAERFTREARALAKLNHSNIIGVHDFGQADGLYYIAMEFVDGVNLRQAIQSASMDPKQALTIIPQICDALQFAHDEGIVHRDIKPENILIDRRGRVKIADFGLAKLFGLDNAEQALTGTQQVMGTWRYMAPEQMDAAKQVDHRADIFSLGVVFYEMLTGDLPIGRFAPPSQRVEVDVRLDEVVLRSLEQEPGRRYQQASAIKTDVESIVSSPANAASNLSATSAHSHGTLRRAWRDWWAERDRRFTWAVQNLLLIVHVIGLFVFLSFRSSSTAVNERFRSTSVAIGNPDPWFTWDCYPEPNIPFRGGFHFLSWSMFIALMAQLAYYIYWQIEKTKGKPLSKWSSPNTVANVWIGLAMTAAIVGLGTTEFFSRVFTLTPSQRANQSQNSSAEPSSKSAIPTDKGAELFEAAAEGRATRVKELIDAGAEPNEKNTEGQTPLMLAAANGNASLAALLIKLGAKLNEQDKQGRTPLMYAAQAGHVSVLQAFSELDRKLRVEGRTDMQDLNGETALIKAVVAGHAGCVQLLLGPGLSADIRIQDKAGQTALIRLVQTNQVQLLRDLIEHPTTGLGTSIENFQYNELLAPEIVATTKLGDTSVMALAAELGHDEIEKLLRQEMQRAVDHFTAALEIGTRHFTSLKYRGFALMALGETEKAEADLAESDKLRPSQVN